MEKVATAATGVRRCVCWSMCDSAHADCAFPDWRLVGLDGSLGFVGNRDEEMPRSVAMGAGAAKLCAYREKQTLCIQPCSPLEPEIWCQFPSLEIMTTVSARLKLPIIRARVEGVERTLHVREVVKVRCSTTGVGGGGGVLTTTRRGSSGMVGATKSGLW